MPAGPASGDAEYEHAAAGAFGAHHRSNRLILTQLPGSQVGPLYLDNHDEAYDWLRRLGPRLDTLPSKQREAPRGTRFSSGLSLVPVVRADEDSEIALASAALFRLMLDNGIGRYLPHLTRSSGAWPSCG